MRNKNLISNKQKGFTLIETLIYIALFSIILTGILLTAYQIIDGSEKTRQKVILEEEANFLMRKFSWATAGIRSGDIVNPSQNREGPVLEIVRGENGIRFSQNGEVIYVERGLDNVWGPTVALSSSNVVVDADSLYFIHKGVPGGGSWELLITFKLNGRQFDMKKVFR